MEDPAESNVLHARRDPEARCETRVAFFGGSFDPPHLGHLAIARAARTALDLERVLFAPVGAQPLKPEGSAASFADRVAMTELAIAGERGFEVSLADAPNADARPNYTLETLRSLRAGLSHGGCLFFLMGADSFASLRHWHRAAEIPFAASLIVASRPGQDLDHLSHFLPHGLTLELTQPSVILREVEQSKDLLLNVFRVRNETGETAPLYVLPGLDVEVSASEIRSQVRDSSPGVSAGRSLPPGVAAYIREHSLYR